jgi:DNA-binding MarR family transcriptional regulator
MTDRSPKNRQQLIEEVFANMNAMKRGMIGHLQAVNRSLPIPRAQCELLGAIKQTQPVSFKSLAQQLYLSPGAVSQMAEGLESAGLIQRETDPDDRRIQCLRMTKAGEKLLSDISKKQRYLIESVVQNLSDEELTIWASIHRKLLQQFQAELAAEKEKEQL